VFLEERSDVGVMHKVPHCISLGDHVAKMGRVSRTFPEQNQSGRV
jgi:hypothetical protein